MCSKSCLVNITSLYYVLFKKHVQSNPDIAPPSTWDCEDLYTEIPFWRVIKFTDGHKLRWQWVVLYPSFTEYKLTSVIVRSMCKELRYFGLRFILRNFKINKLFLGQKFFNLNVVVFSACSFICMWKLVADVEGGRQAAGVWE